MGRRALRPYHRVDHAVTGGLCSAIMFGPGRYKLVHGECEEVRVSVAAVAVGVGDADKVRTRGFRFKREGGIFSSGTVIDNGNAVAVFVENR